MTSFLIKLSHRSLILNNTISLSKHGSKFCIISRYLIRLT
nr:MAG TPA: hypothetical protein [Bacteriophage sp.]